MKRPNTRRAPNVAVIDIGSNSVRLVVYESMARSLVTIFNEKNLCGLGREVQSTGLLAQDAVAKALASLRRYSALCRLMKVPQIYAVATAACRDASNGPAFIAQAERICRVPIAIISGPREARLSALGVISGLHKPDGIVGDLGGGSLELIEVQGRRIGQGTTLPLGSLALQDASQKSPKRATRLVKQAIASVPQLASCAGRTFYAVGGTWRALARLHITLSGYPLRVMHGYSMSAADALAFARRLRTASELPLQAQMQGVADARRPLLIYAAIVLEAIIRIAKPKTIVFSTFGVREGLLFERLPVSERNKDGLLSAARTLNHLLSRSAEHGEELIGWSDRFVRIAGLDEQSNDKRLRHAACLLSDVGWRVHPDHRGEQTLTLITNGNFGSLDHRERVFIALSVFYRYAGLGETNQPPAAIRGLVTAEQDARARVLGAMFRVAHLVSAAQPGVLNRTSFASSGRKLMLVFEQRMTDLVADRVGSRFKQLSRLVGKSGAIVRK